MVKQQHTFEDLGVKVETSCFKTALGKKEVHAMFHVQPNGDLFEGQHQRIVAAMKQYLSMDDNQKLSVAMERYFLSDSTNQAPYFMNQQQSRLSLIQQPPLDGSKVALWLYLIEDVNVCEHASTQRVEMDNYQLLFDLGMQHAEGDSATQTGYLLAEYQQRLAKYGANITDNCIRTWFYVRDVDIQYAGMVKARTDFFEKIGLRKDTHYLASTGIQGLPSEQKSIIQLGAFAVVGLQPEQQQYLYAPTHLNPTYEYGVTFERGTLLRFGDRSHAYISGTASINNKGEVVHVGDIIGQTERMIENVLVLLEEAQMNQHDVAQVIVYLRDLCDYPTVKPYLERTFENTPIVFTLAPVCRPEWLIEMECIAIKESEDERFNNFC